jgi:hypothetical protein
VPVVELTRRILVVHRGQRDGVHADGALIVFHDLEREVEQGAKILHAFEVDVAAEGLGYLLADVQAKSDTFSVDTVSLLNFSKSVEQLGFVGILDADSIIFNRNFDVFFCVFGDYLTTYLHKSSLLGEFERVGQEVEGDLLDAVCVHLDDWII